MSDNLQRQRDESEKDGLRCATGDWAYLRATKGLRFLAFVQIDDMPTIVVQHNTDADGKARVQWYGLWNAQWYSDFKLVEDTMDAINDAVGELLEAAEDTLMNDLHEPEPNDIELEDAVTPQTPPDGEQTP